MKLKWHTPSHWSPAPIACDSDMMIMPVLREKYLNMIAPKIANGTYKIW